MPRTKKDLQPVFEALLTVARPYADRLNWHQETEGYWDLWLDLPHSRTLFVAVAKQRGKATLTLYPLTLWPKLRERIPASLALRMKMKDRFDFDALDPKDVALLEELVAIAYQRWEKETVLGTRSPKRSRT